MLLISNFYETSKIDNALRTYYFVFKVMNTIFHYDLVSIRSNYKIIRYMFQTKNQMFLFYFKFYINT